jgi:hypothetical protein
MLNASQPAVQRGGAGESYNSTSLPLHTDKKEKKIFLIYKEIQNGAVAKSHMTFGLLING